MIPLSDIVRLLDAELRVREIADFANALNGLQVENSGSVQRVALAVDGSQSVLDAALAAGCDLLLLHHGLFWGGLRPLTGWWKKKLETCLRGNLAVYAAHLPLDLHPTLGNNACIARALGLTDTQPELSMKGNLVGIAGNYAGTVSELVSAYGRLTGSPITGHIADAEAPAGRVVVCSGAAGDAIYEVQAKGYRCYLTGEENHWVTNAARDMGLNLLFAGHYATETFGVRALGELLRERLGLPCLFIDKPTGM